ncbi:unnamed protein product, partial [Scytosiphon promiscuus]
MMSRQDRSAPQDPGSRSTTTVGRVHWFVTGKAVEVALVRFPERQWSLLLRGRTEKRAEREGEGGRERERGADEREESPGLCTSGPNRGDEKQIARFLVLFCVYVFFFRIRPRRKHHPVE